MIETWAIKKILRAFENKDVGSINTLVLQHQINPSVLIPGKGVTLLHLIIGHQSESFAFRVTKLFLRCGGDPNVQSSDGVTPTHVAAAWGRNRILHLLLVNGGDPWMQDDEKKNAFNYAFEEREWTTVEMLHHFQQMHSSAHSKKDFDAIPRYERDLERVLLRKDEDLYVYTPVKKLTKSTMTQTQCERENISSSPVQEKIKYFEPSARTELEVSCQREEEKVEVGWLKDFYQTSCEVVVHQEVPPEKPPEKNEMFVSSIHIDPTPLGSDIPPERCPENPSDIRSQLFAELQEAVRRRSRLKLPHQGNRDNEKSVVVLEKEVASLGAVDFEQNGLLKSMSDFATKVMKEAEVAEDQSSGKTIDLCVSSPDMPTTYLSCEEEANRTRSEERGDVHIHQSPSGISNLYLTPLTSQTVNEVSKEEVSNESFASISEEYKYTDVEEGVVLLEKKLLVTPTIRYILDWVTGECGERNFPPLLPLLSRLPLKDCMAAAYKDPCDFHDEEMAEDLEEGDEASSVSSVPSSFSCNSDVLRCELNGLGYNPGPVTKTTKKLYLKKLWRLKKNANQPYLSETESSPVESPLVETRLTDPQRFDQIPGYGRLEEEMCRSFENWSKRKWREGTNKTSFNYLLLDPRLSRNLPKRASGMTEYEAWTCFLPAIFYVGKGKRSRPYAHLYQATALWEGRLTSSPDEKTTRIIEIWRDGFGVVCLQVFQNIIPVEAFTREAAMIDALSLSALKNSKSGEYYGVASTWRRRDKVNLGLYLLHKAMLIFLNEGERQIKPYDID